ncbi:NERD domain-containing protein [Schinkia sp. CFF1]
MAQLIKLRDFISRYETDIYRYPGQFIRLKRERWDALNASYNLNDGIEEVNLGLEEDHDVPLFDGFEDFNENWLENEKKGVFSSIKRWLKKPKHNAEVYDINPIAFDTTNVFKSRKKTKEEVKQEFLDEIFRFQINWASSTIFDRSFVDEGIYKDEILRYFLQHFPDNYLLLYKPTLIVKKAPIDLDITLISPVTTFCISLLENTEMSVFETDRGHYWFERIKDKEVRRVNPLLSLNRTESLIKGYYRHYNVDMPVQKIVLSRTGYIEGDYQPTNTLFIDKRNYSDWYTRLRRLPSPIKFVQLKGAQSLLKHSQSTYMRRYEWEQPEEEMNFNDESGLNDDWR